MDPRLKEAAQAGDIVALYSLIEENSFILEGIDEIPFTDTPLHIAAAAGHVEFAMQILILKPSFARRLNRNLFSPMHLALRNKHTRTVQRLLKADKDLVHVKGRDGKTPLHCAVEEGDLDLIFEFLTACPESIRDVTIIGETTIHIAVKADMFAALEILIGWLQRFCHKNAQDWEKEVLNARDQNGNTVLHTALNSDQHQAVKLLSGCKNIEKSIKNSEGFTKKEIVKSGINALRQDHTTEGSNTSSQGDPNPHSKRLRSKFSFNEKLVTRIIRQRLKITNEMSNAMLVVTTLVIVIAFQWAVSPAGGVRQVDAEGNTNIFDSLSCNVTCQGREVKICDLSCNTRNVSDGNLAAKSKRLPGKSVMQKSKFFEICAFNTAAMALAAVMTMYLLPPSFLAGLFNFILYWSFSVYINSVKTISPEPNLGEIAGVTLTIPFAALIYYWHYWSKAKPWLFA